MELLHPLETPRIKLRKRRDLALNPRRLPHSCGGGFDIV
jgi:hypothetical protein